MHRVELIHFKVVYRYVRKPHEMMHALSKPFPLISGLTLPLPNLTGFSAELCASFSLFLCGQQSLQKVCLGTFRDMTFIVACSVGRAGPDLGEQVHGC
mmetsp:Transcript_26590/g.58376  ORF Transcript_26590/g.58376 Transcript_26590/m.58376 type:complete len:98 (+) Transcript_26590:698-991(+)